MHNEEWYRFLEAKQPTLARRYVYGTYLKPAHFTFSSIPGSIVIEDEETSYHHRTVQTLVCTHNTLTEQAINHYQLTLLSDPLLDLSFWGQVNAATREVIYSLSINESFAMRLLGRDPDDIWRAVFRDGAAPGELYISFASHGYSFVDVDWYAIYSDLCLSVEEIRLRASVLKYTYIERTYQ